MSRTFCVLALFLGAAATSIGEKAARKVAAHKSGQLPFIVNIAESLVGDNGHGNLRKARKVEKLWDLDKEESDEGEDETNGEEVLKTPGVTPVMKTLSEPAHDASKDQDDDDDIENAAEKIAPNSKSQTTRKAEIAFAKGTSKPLPGMIKSLSVRPDDATNHQDNNDDTEDVAEKTEADVNTTVPNSRSQSNIQPNNVLDTVTMKPQDFGNAIKEVPHKVEAMGTAGKTMWMLLILAGFACFFIAMPRFLAGLDFSAFVRKEVNTAKAEGVMMHAPTQEHIAVKVDCVSQRISAFENMGLVSVLVGGFAITDGASFNREAWRSEIAANVYVVALIFSISINMLISMLAVVTITAAHRVASWDSLFNYRESTPDEIYNHKNYQFLMKWMYGNDQSQWTEPGKFHNDHVKVADRVPENDLVLKLPLQYHFFHYMADGSTSIVGAGIRFLPYGFASYFLAVGLSLNESGDTVTIVSCCTMLIPVAIFGSYVMERVVKILSA